MTPNQPTRDTRDEIIQKDIADLKRLGYGQQLLRQMGGFSNFAISFSIISILTGAILLFGYHHALSGLWDPDLSQLAQQTPAARRIHHAGNVALESGSVGHTGQPHRHRLDCFHHRHFQHPAKRIGVVEHVAAGGRDARLLEASRPLVFPWPDERGRKSSARRIDAKRRRSGATVTGVT